VSRLYLLIPLASAVLYAIAALNIKRAIELGMGPWRMTFLSNLVMFLFFGSAFFWNREPWAEMIWWPPLLAGFLFFIGQVFTFLSLTRGDVSIATPVLGLKVLFVAFFLTFLLGDSLGFSIWLAALFATMGIALLQWGSPTEQRGKTLQTVVLAFISAAAFALADVVMKHWCEVIGFARFVPVSSATTLFFSLFLIPFFQAALWQWPQGSCRWVVIGLVLLAIQALGMAVAIGVFADAAGTNIVYASRGLWSVLLIWFLGHYFANQERHELGSLMWTRLLGATLILAAVVLIFI
jgi:drug/metabolite transporter (DMT)-like permease